MIELKRKNLVLNIDDKKLATLRMLTGSAAQARLAELWDTEQADVSHYMAVFYNKGLEQLSETDSFITMSFSKVGYILDANERIDLAEAKKKIEIDLEILNRESQWGKKDSMYFDQWWPTPVYDIKSNVLEFGVSLKDFHQRVFNRTVNRIKLTRFGYLSVNYSMSEKDILEDKPLSYYRNKLDEICNVVTVKPGYRFQDVDKDNDTPSQSRMINLLLSSEIF